MTLTMDQHAPKSLSNLFAGPHEDMCERCHQKVYYMEKIGPLGNRVVFHKQCFKCSKCNQRLTLKTYYANQVDLADREVYCSRCTDKVFSSGLDAQAMGIKAALAAPKARRYNQQIHSRGTAPRIPADAMFITQPTSVQNQYQQKYKQTHDKHHFPAFVVQQKKEVIVKAQENLELVHREEEKQLMSVLLADRHAENVRIKQEMEDEWERKLEELTNQFDEEMNKKTSYKKNKNGTDDSRARTMRFETEKEELKKNMTIRMKQKKEAATIRLMKKEHEETASMVQKQSEQMLEVLRVKQEEIKLQLEKEIHEHKIDENQNSDDDGASMDSAVALEEAMAALSILPKEVPAPHPPSCRKRDLYYDAEIFKDLDEHVFSVAERDHVAFTDLVNELTVHCMSDLEKARVIFRWITVKDLNVLNFVGEDVDDVDSPMGILQGIKYGTETYHTLFMRLCSYAGLACVEIKGHSKSVGYEPGMKIREDTFQNTWNAVLIDGNWWPVQCNWGARHLVLNKDVAGGSAATKQPKSKKQDKIRYQYDEHYFLTDPDEFIQEFWASDQEWQLLERSVSLDEFEAMPFVRSVFFHYGLEFEGGLQSVLHTDSKGFSEVKVRVPLEFMQDLVFHYQIRFADRERRNDTEYRSAKLERFVFHSLVDGIALFSLHVPTAAAFFLEVFANKIDDTNKLGDDPNATMMPFRLKCACKFKVVCDELVAKMHPLPNCASGEWGPSKATRHFNLQPIGNKAGSVSFKSECDIRIKMPSPLHFLCKLRMNGVDEAILEKHIEHSVDADTLHVHVHPPQPGQYGLDIYARPEDATDNHTLAHACKYLLNCEKVSEPVKIDVAKVEESSRMSKDKWGPSEAFEALGLSTLSHENSTIEKNDSNSLHIELTLKEPLKLSYHLIMEPNKDYRDKVTMKDGTKKVKFTIALPHSGNFLFAIYARRKREVQMLNVYNYMIRYTNPKDNLNSLKKSKDKKEKKSLFKK